ncbi:MAG: hypothetical protein IT204_26115 [Fimbriimonadaceae bacterium]|nr:hypothetical protein [Fimbriimonadaceae bacterium]
MRAAATWMREAGWGLFVHYLADTASNSTAIALTPAEWNAQVEAIDVAGLAAQLRALRPGWFFLTLGQNSGFYLSPNATYDSLVPHRPSRLARRDIVAELAAALAGSGVRLMVYLPACAPALDPVAIEALRCTPTFDPRKIGYHPGTYRDQPGVDRRLTDFQRHWEAVIGEWSQRWGDAVSGWWFDGCYAADEMYRHDDAPNFASFAAAARSGHPGSLVAFNPGVKVPVICYTEHEDYTAGEVAHALPVQMDARWSRPLGPTVDGAQYHLLTFAGSYWGQGEPRFSTELLVGYTNHLRSFGGAISWDVPTSRAGLLPPAFVEQFAALGAR